MTDTVPSTEDLDPNTPVLIGVGQASDPIDSPDYQRMSAVDLAGAAAAAAIADAGIDPTTIDTVAGVRQFEISTPAATAPLGRSDNYPRSVAGRVGADPRRAVLEVVGGQSSQHLITEFAKTIARGEASTVLIFGSEAISTTRAFTGREDAPDFTEHADGDLEDRGYGLEGLASAYQFEHLLSDAPSQYALFENARRARRGVDRGAYATEMGELFAPFTRVAAANPYAAAPTVRTAEELVTVTDRNRMIADPYPRFVVARDQVNQGAAVVLTSVAAAREAGVPESRWVFLHGYADFRERDLLDRPDLAVSPASVKAAEVAIERAGITADQIATFDLYSCFPIAVLNIVDGLGIAHTDPRGLTLTGGLPFFGGAGNNYSMHAVAETVQRLREHPGSFGFVGANGGSMSKYSAAVYSTAPTPFAVTDDAENQAALNALPAPATVEQANGPATIETYTVKYARDAKATGVIVGRLENGDRFLATTVPDDRATIELLLGEEPFGARIHVASTGRHNFASVDADLAAAATRSTSVPSAR